MSPGDVIRISPDEVRYKLFPHDLDLGGIKGGDWDLVRPVPIEGTDKHISVFQRYVEGLGWGETEVFQNRYANALRIRERVRRGARSLQELVAVYERELDPIFADMKVNGFREGKTPVKVHLGRNGDLMLGNDGNHRLAMAKVLGLASVFVKVHTRHADYRETRAA